MATELTPEEAARQLRAGKDGNGFCVLYEGESESIAALIEQMQVTLEQYADATKWRELYADSKVYRVWIPNENGCELAHRKLKGG